MARKKQSISQDKPTQLLVDKDFLDVCLWSSARYFVGRHTIAASCHASDIAKLVAQNPEVMTTERKKFFAKDIRESISNCMGYHFNVQVSGFSDDVDALTLMCVWISNHLKETGKIISFASRTNQLPDENTFNPNYYKWEIDLYNKTVHIEELKDGERSAMNFSTDILDLTPWMKLAGYLDPNQMVTFNPGALTGESSEPSSQMMFGFPVYGTYMQEENPHFFMGYCSPDQYIKSTTMDTYLSPEVITEIKSIYL